MRKLILILLLACSACTQAQDPARSAAPGGAPAASAPAASAPVSGAPAAGAPAAGKPAGGDTLARIRTLIGEASCTDSGQCRTLPIGAMACGGPESYLPYSKSRTDEKALRALGEQYKAERIAENKTSGLMSICRYLTDPGAVCTGGSCQLTDSSSSAPSGPPVAR